MKRMQRLVSLLLSLVLAASLLAACGGNSGNNSSASGGSGGAADDAGSASQSGEPIEITVGFWNVEAGLSGGMALQAAIYTSFSHSSASASRGSMRRAMPRQ